jgi:trans-aconitate methyltransferase
MYSYLAEWWPLLSPPDEYIEEATFFLSLFDDAQVPHNATLLELGSGGGSNAFHLRHRFAHLTLTDLAPEMLAISEALNPECEHLLGDMLTMRLGRTFDVVFVHDAIDYMTTADDLARAVETAAIHCKPGSIALFVPDYTAETFEPYTDHDGQDGTGRALRYMEWTFDPDPADSQYTTEYVFVLRRDALPVEVIHETHIGGLFPRALWVELLTCAGFSVTTVQDGYERDLFLCRKR